MCCSFCLKDKDSVAKLVAGLGVYICNECVELCSLIIAEDPAPRVGGWDEQPDDALLANLGRLQAVVSQVDAALHNHVGMLRDRGVSWTRDRRGARRVEAGGVGAVLRGGLTAD